MSPPADLNRLPWRRGPTTVVLPLRSWLAVSHVLALVLAVAAVLGTGTLSSDLRNQTREDLEHQGAVLALHAADRVRLARERDPDAGLDAIADPLSALLRDTKRETLAGIRVTDASGRVVATSGTVIGEDLASDAEVAAALEGRSQVVVRPRPDAGYAPLASDSRRARVRLFVARPVQLGDELLGVVVLSRTPREELQALYRMAPDGLVLGVVASLAATIGLALLSGWILTRSLGVLARGADRVAEGASDGLALLADPAASHVAEVASVAGSVRTMTERLRDRIGYIAEFASNVSHEFKTPLATLRGTVELLADDDEMPPEQRERFLANATAELDRLERLVTGLLALARAEEVGGRRRVPLGDVARASAERNGVTCVGDAGAVDGNPAQIDAAVENLVRNALRYGAAPVVVTAWEADGRAGVDVQDAGAGISDANLSRVFDRFFTTDRGGGGTGLGLALVKAIAEAHGGRVSVESQPGRTVFRLALPRAS